MDNEKKYYVIRPSEDGARLYEYTKEELEKKLTEEYSNLEECNDLRTWEYITDVKKNYDPNYWGAKILIIKGKIVVPKKKEVITKMEVE